MLALAPQCSSSRRRLAIAPDADARERELLSRPYDADAGDGRSACRACPSDAERDSIRARGGFVKWRGLGAASRAATPPAAGRVGARRARARGARRRRRRDRVAEPEQQRPEDVACALVSFLEHEYSRRAVPGSAAFGGRVPYRGGAFGRAGATAPRRGFPRPRSATRCTSSSTCCGGSGGRAHHDADPVNVLLEARRQEALALPAVVHARLAPSAR